MRVKWRSKMRGVMAKSIFITHPTVHPDAQARIHPFPSEFRYRNYIAVLALKTGLRLHKQ
ncbi:hypothetical protein GALMADRAFT_906536 [Galerina marginata CBS 339.88]|uniref:Uncharacterized protein n=1 Tax=Galerina marginata (strain CBS 339.88) TaxID=685588 RepID=A0A067SPU0_GALM3|nr:hypothetical protein GALMADRAFT_906536 [Galerina marginata CBS 339.88]